MFPTIDLMAPQHRRDPYPDYAEMRRSRPVCRVEPGGLIAVSRYKDVELVLKSPKLFSSHGFRAAWQPEWAGDNPLAQSLVASDGEEHARLRAIVSRAFTPASVSLLDAGLRANAAELADRLREQGEADFMESFATPLPARAMTSILGLDPSLESHYKRWTEVIVGITPVPQSEEHVTRTRAAIAEMKGYMQQVIDERRSRPSKDVMGLIVQAEADGQRLSDREIIALSFNLLAAGLETTSFLFSNAVLLLSSRPDVLARLRADRTLLPRFIEEMLRYDGPVPGLLRMAMADVELSGVRVESGACVFALIASANRDGEHFSDPDRFDLDRGRPGISFGYGAHHCLGAFLAQLEARAGLDALLDRFSGFELDPSQLEWNRSLTARGPVEMPVRFLVSGT